MTCRLKILSFCSDVPYFVFNLDDSFALPVHRTWPIWMCDGSKQRAARCAYVCVCNYMDTQVGCELSTSEAVFGSGKTQKSEYSANLLGLCFVPLSQLLTHISMWYMCQVVSGFGQFGAD